MPQPVAAPDQPNERPLVAVLDYGIGNLRSAQKALQRVGADARLTADLRDATVYYTVFGSDAERADSAAALESAKGIIRSEVGRQLGLRHTPTITFVHDPLPENARHIDELLAQARARDEEIARKAQGARPAGDPDPYRKPVASDDLDDADQEEGEEDDVDVPGGVGRRAK